MEQKHSTSCLSTGLRENAVYFYSIWCIKFDSLFSESHSGAFISCCKADVNAKHCSAVIRQSLLRAISIGSANSSPLHLWRRAFNHSMRSSRCAVQYKYEEGYNGPPASRLLSIPEIISSPNSSNSTLFKSRHGLCAF